MTLSWMVFETSSTFTSVKTSSLETKPKEKWDLFFQEEKSSFDKKGLTVFPETFVICNVFLV